MVDYILDGGMGRELQQMGAPFRQPEWSALSLMETPDMVRSAHENFIKAGAQVITTSCYAVVPFHIGQERFDKEGRNLIALSAKLAREAADKAPHDVLVAGCLPPLFGSYCPECFDETQAPAMLAAFIEEQMPYVDLWLAETLSARRETLAIRNALNAAANTLPLWISFCLSEDSPNHIRSTLTIEDIVMFTQAEIPATAILYNCCAMEKIEDALKRTCNALKDRDAVMVGAYPNLFEKTPKSLKANESLNPLRDKVLPGIYAEYAQKWAKAGANIIGGCCGVSPAHIAAVKTTLENS